MRATAIPRPRHPLSLRLAERAHDRAASSAATASESPDAPAETPGPAVSPVASPAPPFPLPDLLHPEPRSVLDAAAVDEAFAFAFLSGDDAGGWDRALPHADLAPSTFEPRSYLPDLFVLEALDLCFFDRGGSRRSPYERTYVARLVGQPPRDTRTIPLRQRALLELVASPPLRASLEHLHAQLGALRLQLTTGGAGAQGPSGSFRVGVLRALLDAFDALVAPPLLASRTVLRRVASFGLHVRATEGHARLVELLAYDARRAEANLRVELGADGRIRHLEVVRFDERSESPYHLSPLRRYLRSVGLFLAGYRLPREEVLERWLDEVFDGVRAFLPPLVQLMGDLELYLAALRFRDRALERGLPVCLPTFARADEPVAIEGLWNPLLLAQPGPIVPSDLDPFHGPRTAVLTGPNSGGKTRFLQARGLLQLFAQAGLFVPAAEARLRVVPGMFASTTDGSHADAREGRLGTELGRVRDLFERASPGHLVLLDELCSGTNPSEGQELFQLVLELLGALGPEAYVSTHFLSLIASLEGSAAELGLAFLQVELDAESAPTHRVVPGIATTSLARETAARLGVTREELHALLQRRREATAAAATSVADV